LLLALVMGLVPSQALGAEWPVANPERPSFSFNAPPTAYGALELETGIARDSDGGAAIPSTLKFGAFPALDLRLNVAVAPVPEIGTDVSLQCKALLSDPKAAVLYAVSPYAGLTLVGSDGWRSGNVFIVEWLVLDFELDSNLIVDVAKTSSSSEFEATLFPVLTLNHALVGPLGGYVEGHAEIPATGGAIGWVAATGLGYALFPNLVFDGAIDVGLAGPVPEYMVQFGLTGSMYAFEPKIQL